MTTMTGSNGNDLLTGTAGSDTINSGNGDDSVYGGAGNDSLNGGAGNDVLDGGSGSDQLNGGSGNDTLVYNVSENVAAGTKDVYTGGAGLDTLQLQFTRAQWLDSANQTQIAAYLAHLAAVTNARTGEVSNGSASDFVFSFGSSTLTVQMTETLRILVDGLEVNPANEAVQALGDVGAATEDGPAIQIHVLQNDAVPDLVKSLALASAPAHGTATLVQPAMGDPSTWYFQYQPHAAGFQHLAAGETATDTFTYQVTDADGGTGVATVTVTITGTNDGPVITAQDLAGAVSEQVAPSGQLSDSGVIGFSDLDLSDVHLVSATGTPIGSVLGSLTAVKNGDTTGTGTGGQLTWTYTVDAAAVEYLAAGETRVESFTITVNDQHGGIVTRQIDVTITGTNDAPTIGAGDAAAAVTEDASAPTLSDSGTITFDDVDLSDAHGVSVAVAPGNTLGGVLTATVSDAATGAGDGTVSWNYSVANAATQYLAQGQTATEIFTVSISDGHGGTVNQQITVTVTGTNDVPVIGGVASGAVSEDGAAPNLSTSGALTIADVDQGQSNFAPQASTSGSNGYGSFTLAANGTWTYAADNNQSAIQQLGAGQSISESFTAVSSDGTASQLVTVTITGTNDVPVIGGVATGAVSEDASVPNLSAGGALTIADVDQGQSNFAPQASTGGNNGYGSFTLAADGNWSYTADNSQAAIQQLAAGQSLSDSFTAVSSDGTASQVVTVTITGTNDVPVIGGVASGTVNEDDSAPSLSTGGVLTITDVDAGQSNFAPQVSTAGSGGYGSFTLAADGNWSYTADNSQAAIQQLGAGQSLSDSFTAVSSDGTASQLVTATITGTNDVPVIAGVASSAVNEDDSAPSLSAEGALTIADVDQGQSNFAPQASTAGSGGYGSFTLAADGNWSYTADNSQAAIQQLGAGESISDSFTAVSSDGTASQVVTVTITGTNDVPVIGGVASGAASEDASTSNLSTGGALTIADVDQGQSNFTPQTGTTGGNGYGSFSLLADGSWSYTADNSQSAIQQLGAGESISDSFTAVSSDGTVSQVVTVTITGTNDVPVIAGVASGTVNEDDSAPSLSTGGALTIADVDQGQSNFGPQASTGGSNGYGSFTLAADGNWSYTADNNQSAIQQLGAGESLSDSFTAVSSDGTASQLVTVTITGTNDVPVIGGVASGAASEDASTPNLGTGGALTIADVDQGQSNFTPQTGTTGGNGYGSFSLLADGSWSYTADNSQSAIQQLGAGESISDSFTAVSSDGTVSQVVTVTITGTNDVPVIAGVASGTVNEDDSAPSLSTGGALTIADVDQGQSNFGPQASTGGSNGYGSFTLAADGNWSYTADNNQSAIQQLGAGESLSDSFTAVSSDGTASQLVTVTITGTNDVPVIGGVAIGAVSEDASTPNLSTNGAVTIVDVDAGQSNFAPQASTAGSNGYGSFNLLADGSWTYTADNSQSAIQQLGAGQSISDSFTAVSSDGTASQLVTVTITGTNDVPVIGGVASGAVSEDGATPNLSTGGALTIADVDQGQSNFAPQASTAGSNGYGSFTLAADGGWSYSADNSQTAIQQLAAGQSVSDSFTAVSSDGTASELVTVTITGTNDVPVIGGVASGAVSEDASTPSLSTSGALTIADVDAGQSNFAPQASTAGGNGYGNFTLAADGSWSYTADNNQSAIQQLGAGESLSDSFTAVSSDGTASQLVTVTITGTNDVPVIGGVATGALNEDASTPNLSTSGALTIADVDAGQSSFTAQAGTAGSNGYGSFALAANGNWTYTANNSQAAIQQLGAGQSLSDSFTAVSSDGTASQLVTVTITGTNDVPVIGGVASGAVSEDDSTPNLSTNGALTIADVDAGQSNFIVQPGTAGGNGYGNFTLAADGSWSYDADNSQSAIQQLGAGQSISDSFTAVSSDDAASQVVTVTITGTNDVPVIGGVATGAASEDASTPNLSTSGALTIADVDAGQSNFAPQASTAGGNGYGSFTLAADGNWTYTANNSQTAIQQLAAGQTISDSFTAVSSDGTASQLVTVTITGTNDVPVIAGVASGAVSEDASAPNLSTSGALTIADVDQGQSNFAPQVSTAGSHGHGSFTLAVDGSWSYAADNSQAAIQQLGAGQSISDSFTAVSSDGTANQVVTVTITGTNDVPVIGGVASGAVSEDASTPNLSTGGALTIADVDAGQSSFTAQAGTTGSNGYGSFTLAAGGNWTYTASDSQAAVQQLAAGQSIIDSFTAVSSDGTASQLVTVTIAGTNDAPVLRAAATPALVAVNEDAGAPVGAVGTLVSSLVNLNPPAGGLDNVTDADNGAITGIALTGVNADNGSWWYSTNGGANWAVVGAVSDASALLLAADANTRVYFDANSNFSGTVSDGVTFRAWDQTSGTAGTTASTVTNGGSSAFSSATDIASLTVSAVNDNPVAAADRIIVSSSTLVTLSVSSLLGNDTDIDGLALTITSVGSAVGISGLTLDAANGTISFTSGSTAGATAGSFQYTVSDGAGGTTTATATIDVRAVSTGNGADTIDLSAAGTYQASYIDGRGGADVLTGGAAGDVFIGGAGNSADTLTGSAGNDLLVGGDGNDTLSGGAGNDVLNGGIGSNDSMDGGAGSEDLLDFSDGTLAVNFTLVQSAASTSIANGTAGLGNNDTYQNIEGVIGTGLADTITGSTSNDIIRGGKGNDTLDGAGGTGDLLDFSDGTAGLTFTLTQSSSTTSFNASAAGLGTDGYKNFEGVIGTAFADTITGSALNDQLRGGGGNDVINGLSGDDRIAGGTGADILTGGADNDTFVFDSAPNAVDSVTDFNASGSAGSGDLVELSRGTFTALSTASGSTLSAAEFASSDGGGAGDVVGAGVHVIYDSATGNLYYDADGSGAANRTLVATLTLSNPADTFDSNDIKVGA
ncbi:VCBS repeat-containing protein [Variovorax paradoxus]|uniref:VCBS domain-containing protein n=1 Tax=Variovorax paradoxus TaxID=34073 RepID=UPI00279294A5|nr:VCBS domain-containing protein [Variovorax paradoxus]MDQ0568544.1 VCBS repeat-containing protein [Variovorax paradoxus]